MMPHIDRLLVSGGMELEQHYVARACAPSRRSLLSGRFVQTVGAHNHDCPGLPLGATTLAEKLKEAGYATHLLGKVRTRTPAVHGPFDAVAVVAHGHACAFMHPRL